MKVYIPNKDYLIPFLSDNRIITGDNPVNYIKIFYNFGKFSKFPSTLPDNYWNQFTLSAPSSTSRTKPLYASVNFNIQNENFKLFWSNFGYVGKVGENIWVICLPKFDHMFSHQYSSISENDYKHNGGETPDKAASIEEIEGIFSVIVDPYEELSDDLQILLDCLQYGSIFGSANMNLYPYSEQYIKSKLKEVISLISTSQITQTYEIYSVKINFYFYQGITVIASPADKKYTNGLIAVLREEIPEYFPFKIEFVDQNLYPEEKVLYLSEYAFSDSSNLDLEDLKSIFSTYVNNTRSKILYDNSYKIGDTNWNVSNFFQNFDPAIDKEKLMNCAEIFLSFSAPTSIISISNSKTIFIFPNLNTKLKTNVALNKLISNEGIFTRYWGYTPKNTLDDTEDEIKDLFQETNPEQKPSIAFKGFSSTILLDPDNDINDPSYTDFYYILTPGLNLYQSSHREITSDILTICESREGDSIYLIPVQSFEIDDSGEPNLSQIINLNDLISYFETDLIGSKFGYAIYPDAFITHPFTGELTLIDTSIAAIIKFGQLDKVYQSPAGFRRGVIDFIAKMTRKISKSVADRIYTNAHINPILRPTKYSLPQIEGNRTLYKKGSRVKSALSYINVRGLIQYLIRALREILYTFKFEPNDPFLFTRFQSLITPTLDRLTAEGALYAYKLQNLTTPDDINKGRFVVGIGIQPTREAEIIEAKIYVFPSGSEIKFG